MKKTFMTSMLVILTCSMIYGQSGTSFGINAGLAIPTGDMSDTHNMGFGFGAIVNFPTSSMMGIVIGGSYITLSGKTESGGFAGYSYEIEYESADLISVFAGPQIGKETGLYFLPALSGNFDEGESRFGVDIGGGYLMPFGSGNMNLNISAKYSLTNLIGKEEGEGSCGVIRILAGINF